MAKDLKRVRRLAKVLSIMEHVGRGELLAASRALDDAVRSHDDVLKSLSGDEFLGGPFIDLLARRLPQLSVAVERQAHQHAALQHVWQDRQMRAIALERRVQWAWDRQARFQESVELEDILEAVLRRSPQASGKPGA